MYPSNRVAAVCAMAIVVVASTRSLGQSTVIRNRAAGNPAAVPRFHLGTFTRSLFSPPARTLPSRVASSRATYPSQSTPYRSPNRVAQLPESAAGVTGAQAEYSQFSEALPVPEPIPSTTPVPITDNSTRYVAQRVCRCGATAVPLGTAVNAYFDAHVFNGERDRLVLYHYDFQSGPGQDPARLNAAGRRKVASLLSLIESSGQPLIVQQVEQNASLSQARRANVLSFLQVDLGYSPADAQVIVGYPESPGLKGAEAIDVDRSRQQNTRSLGVMSSGFPSGSSNLSRGQGIRTR